MHKATKRIAVVGAVLLCGASLAACGSSSSSKSSSDKAAQEQKERKSANKALAKDLAQSQGWANGTIDENGNSTSNGQPNADYNWATHVSKVKYTKDDDLEIYLYDADKLTVDQVDEIAHRAQKSAISTLYMEHVIDSDTTKEGVYTTVYQGNQVLGHTKALDRTTFKWND